jgi:hypothetical protein
VITDGAMESKGMKVEEGGHTREGEDISPVRSDFAYVARSRRADAPRTSTQKMSQKEKKERRSQDKQIQKKEKIEEPVTPMMSRSVSYLVPPPV